MTKTHGKDYVSQKMLFYGVRKTIIPSQSSWDLFTISFRVVRTRTAEHFSLVGDVHRIMWEIPSGTTLKLKISTQRKVTQ